MDIGSILHVIWTALVLVCMISILVAAHEYGHYLIARLFGMGVEEFSIGFGRKPIWTWMRKSYTVEPTDGAHLLQNEPSPSVDLYPTDGSAALKPEPSPSPSATKLSLKETTDFTVRPWPLGGFVRIKGMVPEEDGSETRIPGGFYSKAPWKRLLVLLAGPVFSVAAGVLILFLQTIVMGRQIPTGEPRLSNVREGQAAWKAGLRNDDLITSVDGAKVSSAYDVMVKVRDRGDQNLVFTFIRQGKEMEATVTPKWESDMSPVIGPDYMPTDEVRRQAKLQTSFVTKRESVPAGTAFSESVKVPIAIVGGMVDMIRAPSKIKDNVGGPASIAKATSDATREGVAQVVFLAAMLSISVGIFNLLPIPPLDGGQMVVAIAEILRGGKRLSLKVQGAVTAIGMALVLVMFVSIMFIDVGRLTKSEPPAASKTK